MWGHGHHCNEFYGISGDKICTLLYISDDQDIIMLGYAEKPDIGFRDLT